MNRYITLGIAIASLLLPGCRAWEDYNAEQMAKREAADKQQCANMGAPEGSRDYYQCRRDLIEQERHERTESRRAVDAYLDREQRAQASMRSNHMSCMSSNFAGSIRTTCD